MPMHTILILLITFLFPQYIFAQTNSTTIIPVGSSITAAENSNSWLSPSGDFAFGFQPLRNTTDLFILSIWFNRIPDQTIVWFQRSSYPVPRGSTLQLTAARGLLLRDPNSRTLWNTDGFADEVSNGSMSDAGNFILYGTSNNSAMLWQSFSNPSDTILPTQTIEIDGGTLISRRTETDFSAGRFYARMDGSGSFVFETRNVPTNTITGGGYYSSPTSDTNSSRSGFRVLLSDRGSISVMRRDGQQTILSGLSIPSASENYYRATLDFDGIFTLYYHPRNFSSNPGWTSVSSWPEDICAALIEHNGSGACGYNSVCRLENQRQVCQCPQGYLLVDPNNPYGDCMPRFIQNCVNGGNDSSSFEMLEISDTNWAFNDYETVSPISIDDCRDACLNDCLCSAAIYARNICWKKAFPRANGRVETTTNTTAFLKFRRGDAPVLSPNVPNPYQPQTQENRRTLVVVGSVLFSSSVFINLLFITAACLGWFLIYRKKVGSTTTASLRCFTYKELVRATKGFKEELGRGAFGIVFKGEMHDVYDSKRVVAVKKLDRVSEDSDKEFKTEVNVIGLTHHKNLVRLLGFCNEGVNRLLVYEYMSKRTLAEYIFGDSKPSWSQRCLMAQGISRGITYLHEECSTQIIHCDIKPQNILIDEDYNARISDFGLAKLMGMNKTRTLTNIRGTKGYVAPEWFRNTQISAKVDVYSFGVLLLEIVSCRKSVVNIQDEENPILTDWVWDCFQEKRLDTLVDDDMEALTDRKRLERFVMVGIWCIQEDVSLRPTMRKVSQMLEGIVQVTLPPCPSPMT